MECQDEVHLLAKQHNLWTYRKHLGVLRDVNASLLMNKAILEYFNSEHKDLGFSYSTQRWFKTDTKDITGW